MVYKILIANEYNDYSLKLVKTLTKEKKIHIVDIVDNENEIFNMYLKYKPDVLIMNSSFYNIFFSMYEKFYTRDFYNQSRQNIILLSAQSNLLPIYKNKKIYEILEYTSSADVILDIINEMFDNKVILSDSLIKKQVYQLLLSINIQPNDYAGSQYLIESVLCCYRNNKLMTSNLKDIYKEVAFDFENEVSPDIIKWRIENLFKAYNKTSNSIYLTDIFKYYDKNKNLTPKYFIELALEYLVEINYNI